MPCLQKVLAGLILFSPAAYALATPDEALAGKVKGFTGPKFLSPPTGDYLTASFCYCEWPKKMEDAMGPAHWYQFEYYNKADDITFILTSACPDGDIGYDINCVPGDGGKYALAGLTMHKTCKLWDGWVVVKDNKEKKQMDEFCYVPNHKRGEDYIYFNGQKRNLGPDGRQKQSFKVAEETCDNLCRENMDMPVLKDKRFPPSHQVVWILDDMCSKCD